jgi:hypothetical protein
LYFISDSTRSLRPFFRPRSKVSTHINSMYAWVYSFVSFLDFMQETRCYIKQVWHFHKSRCSGPSPRLTASNQHLLVEELCRFGELSEIQEGWFHFICSINQLKPNFIWTALRV